MTIPDVVMVLAIMFKLGMWFERWLSGRLDDMELAYQAGYDEGKGEA